MSAVLKAREPSARYLEAIQPALVRQFELLATAEGGVTRLRELILTLAVQGKLVPQCPGEAPASEILARARAAAAEQRRERRKSASSDIEPFEPDEGSPALPPGWEWCRGADLYTVVRGVTYQKADASDSPRDDYLPILRANNIQTTINFDGLVYVPGSLVSDEQLLRSGDFVVCLASGSKNLVGKAAVFTGEKVCSFGAFCGAIRLAVPLPFFSAFLASALYREAVAEASSGIGINNLKSSTLLGLAIALPPEAEQARIVARVDELMRLCDALEAKGRLEAEQHARLLGTLLGTLTDSSTPEELAANWQRVTDHFDLLLDRPEAVAALEQAILQLAVRGLLVPQVSGDQPASSLLEQIRANGVQKKAKGRKVEAVAPEVQLDEVPFEVPESWAWSRFGQVAEIASDLVQPAGHGSEWQVAPDCIEKGTGRLLAKRTVADADVKSANHRFHPGQIIYSKIRPSLSKAVIVDFAGLCSADMYPINAKISTQYLLLAILSRCFLDQVAAAENRVKMPKLNQEALTAFLVPVPPLAEQERIVARVTDLRRLCTDLRQRLSRSSATQAALAEALIDYALAA